MILLAAYGLAGSGQHATIPDFVDRAARRMWAAAEAKPSTEVLTAARELATHPYARRPQPSLAPTGPLWTETTGDGVEPVRGAGRPPHLPDDRQTRDDEPVPQPTVTMTARHNQHVYQAGGDQYIVGA